MLTTPNREIKLKKSSGNDKTFLLILYTFSINPYFLSHKSLYYTPCNFFHSKPLMADF